LFLSFLVSVIPWWSQLGRVLSHAFSSTICCQPFEQSLRHLGCHPRSCRPRRTYLQKAETVIVSETPRLLRLSANKQFPNGLANSSGLVGKYLMFNRKARSAGLFPYPLNDYQGFAANRVLHDFYGLDFEKVGFNGGGALGRCFTVPPIT
jgi:hypothetical protein